MNSTGEMTVTDMERTAQLHAAITEPGGFAARSGKLAEFFSRAINACCTLFPVGFAWTMELIPDDGELFIHANGDQAVDVVGLAGVPITRRQESDTGDRSSHRSRQLPHFPHAPGRSA